MNLKSIIGLSILGFGLLLINACEPLPPPPSGAVFLPNSALSSSATNTKYPNSSSQVSVTATRIIVVTPTPEPIPQFVEDCMGDCHFPDASEYFAAGAKSQPSDHKGRVTCLECHKTLAKPALPQDHDGRMDPACALCHLSLDVSSPSKK